MRNNTSRFIQFTRFISTLLVVALCFACAKKSSTTSSEGAASVNSPLTGQTASVLSADSNGYYCSAESSLGTTLGSNGMVKILDLQTGGSFSYTVLINNNSSTGCTGNSSNGQEIAFYTLAGTYTLGNGVSASGVTATKVVYTIEWVWMQLNTGNPTQLSNFSSWLSSCTGITFDPSSTSNQSMLGAVCPASAGFNAVNFPVAGDVVYDLVYGAGAGELQSGPRQDMWRPGETSYPTTLTDTYTP